MCLMIKIAKVAKVRVWSPKYFLDILLHADFAQFSQCLHLEIPEIALLLFMLE